jgi:hydrogenase maturation factor
MKARDYFERYKLLTKLDLPVNLKDWHEKWWKWYCNFEQGDFISHFHDKCACGDLIVTDLYRDFIREFQQIVGARKIKRYDSLYAVVQELNIKFNALCELIHADCGRYVLFHDGFRIIMDRRLKQMGKRKIEAILAQGGGARELFASVPRR